MYVYMKKYNKNINEEFDFDSINKQILLINRKIN